MVLIIITFLLLRPLVARFLSDNQKPNNNRADTPAKRRTAGNAATSRGEFVADALMWAGVVALMIYVYVASSSWQAPARMLPQAIAIGGLFAAAGFVIFKALGIIPPLDAEASEPLPAV
ncbi:MAG: hypothetical protein VW828_07040, partial [Candidatus Puniceispirillum sp.]